MPVNDDNSELGTAWFSAIGTVVPFPYSHYISIRFQKNKPEDANVQPRKRQRTNDRGKRKSVQAEKNDESDFSDAEKFSDDEEGGIRIDDIYIPPAPPPVCSYESSGPRLIITHIVNENFKSYAGRVLVGPFDKVMIELS